jgi:hypothetical protein
MEDESSSIFYSWQNDLDPKYNRYFIRDCLKAAIAQLNASAIYGETQRLDSDTADVPGTPDITSTIFDKISSCAVFIADLSYCHVSPQTGKHLPNSNVLIELGYAFATVSDLCVLNVMNLEFGEPDELPFDLKHKRWPIQYRMNEAIYADKAELKNEKDKLTCSFRDFMRVILDLRKTDISKPVRAGAPSMKYIARCLQTSDAAQDWDLNSVDRKTVAIYRDDVYLSIEVDYEDGVQAEDFREPWANIFPDPRAVGYWVDFKYAGVLIPSMRSILVSVDGGRAMLPIPRQAGISSALTEVMDQDYKVAQIFDANSGQLDNYLWRARLTVAQ